MKRAHISFPKKKKMHSLSGEVVKVQVWSIIPLSHRTQLFSILLALVGTTDFSDSLQSYFWHQCTLFHEVISCFWGEQAPQKSFHIAIHELQTRVYTHTHKHTQRFSHPSSSVGHLWSFPLNISLTHYSRDLLISSLLISSVWPSK